MKKILLILLLISSTLTFAKPKKTIRVACVGNSVTYGYGLKNREIESYPARLQKLLGNGYQVENFGHSGTTLLSKGHRPYINQVEYKNALDYKADLVIIHLGLNDTDPRNWINYQEDFQKNYHALIDTFRVINPKAKIWICLMSPVTTKHYRFESGTRDWYWQIQDAIRLVAKSNNTGLINLNAPLYTFPNLFPDAIHPTAEGANIIANTVYKAITGNYPFTLPMYYSDNMVLQRDMPLHVKGTAPAGSNVLVELVGNKRSAITDAEGQWEVVYPQQKAGGPYTLTITNNKNKKQFNNVYIGEVWVCSGQSNMEFMLKQSSTYKEDINTAEDKRLHFFDQKVIAHTDRNAWDSLTLVKVNHLEYYKPTTWQQSNKETAANFSAVAYHFGRMLSDSLGVHVGLILNAVGGSTLESWTGRKTLEYNYPAIFRDFYTNDHIMQWARGRAKENTKLSKDKMQRHPYEASYLFEAAVMPLKDYDFKGVIWYQGESNEHNIELYERLFPLFEQSWREYLKRPDLPFYVVQLSSINRPSWPRFRDSQRRLALQQPQTYLTVSSDKGDSLDVHPKNKRPIGLRLALQALKHSYNKADIVSTGPEIVRCEKEDNKLRLYFNNAKGMTATHGFEVAGENGLYTKANFRIEGNSIVVWADGIDAIQARYGWEPFTRADLKNSAGLPASTFSIDYNKIRCAEPSAKNIGE